MYLDQIKSSKEYKPRRTMLYGVHGIGKSTWAAKWPNPIFVPTEDGISDLDVPSFPVATNVPDAWGPLLELSGQAGHDFKTVVIDSIDWLERIIWTHLCEEHGKKAITDFDFGKGYGLAAEKVRRYLKSLDACRDAGMHILLIAHSKIEQFKSPEGEAYDRYVPKTHRDVSSILQEWSDEVLFANYKVFTRTTSDGKFGQERNVGVGEGERIILTSERAAYQAKNRLNLPHQLPFNFESYEPYLLGENNGEPAGL